LLLLPSVTVSLPSAPTTTDIYPLSLHDALPICSPTGRSRRNPRPCGGVSCPNSPATPFASCPGCCSSAAVSRWRGPSGIRCCGRSEELTSELQSRENLVCRLLLEKKKITLMTIILCMVQIAYISDNQEEVVNALAKRNLDAAEIIQIALYHGEQRRATQAELVTML